MRQQKQSAAKPAARYEDECFLYEWRYTRWGCVKHLVHVGGRHTMAVCGVAVDAFADWFGTGTQDEHDTLARFEECRTCHNRIRRYSNSEQHQGQARDAARSDRDRAVRMR